MMTDRAPRRILVLGGTGTIGRATARVLVARGHDVVCLVRRAPDPCVGADLDGAELRLCDVTDPASLARDGIRGERFDVVLSCLASRTGAPEDAWRIDHDAHVGALKEAKAAGIPHMILLSAICVQKPKLEFQRTKLAFETKLIESGIDYTIVRPTAFFKSLSGQVERVRQGKRFVMFGDGTLTACKPISDDDLAAYLADCIDNPERRNRILAIGGPGEAITPRMQGEQLFAMLGQTPRFRQVPVALLDAIILALATAGRFVPALRAKAELARIGRYYATESMLVLDPETGRYDADATPSTGSETLFDYYRRLLRSEATAERGEHAVF
ncbi:NAD(P)H-binding protein [Alteriqipengyuania lutimaris]|nr:NAD(P)H-binding protein [Alteriqipengyuania lutimaris]MBB3032614.1 divinyl chlorophyllide a 8-vinyl-reductase [Alteriqipengyuania lutimaris]